MKEDFSDIGSQVSKAFSQEAEMLQKAPKNTFHLDWPQKVLADLVTTEQQKLIAKYGSDTDLLKGPAWSGVDDNRFSSKKFLAVDDGLTVTNKVVGGAAAIVAMSAAGLAIWQAIPDEYKKEEFRKKSGLSGDSLKLTGSGAFSCQYKNVNQIDFCLSASGSGLYESMKVNCFFFDSAKWYDEQKCGGKSFAVECPLNDNRIRLFTNNSKFSCVDLANIFKSI